MKKKILCLALCLIMIFASLVGCTEENRAQIMNKIGKDASNGALTVTMALLAEKAVSAEQEALVEAAINEYMSSYGIKLDIKYYTADKYYEKVETDLQTMLDEAAKKKAELESNRKNPNATQKATETDEEYIYTNENGQPQIVYPENEEYHVDIFYFSGYDRYLKYKQAGYLADFSTQLKDTNASQIKYGVSSILYEGAKALNSNYNMMPCNTLVGEYTCLLLNKDILKSTNYSSGDIKNLMTDKCADLLSLVKNYYPSYVPLYSSEGPLSFNGVKFFGVDENGFASDEFSLLAGTYDYSWKNGVEGQAPDLSQVTDTLDCGNGTVQDQIIKLKNYEFNGYYGTEADADKPFAVGYVKGDISLFEKYRDDYEIVVLENPKLETEDVYENAFAISSHTKNLPKTALVLSEIYKNEKVVNILAHGIEGVNYNWVDSEERDEETYEFYKVIEPVVYDEETKAFEYYMDPDKIGNSVAVYPTVNDNPIKVENMRKQNYEASYALTFGFYTYDKDYTQSLKNIIKDSKSAYDLILNAKNAEELDAAFVTIGKYLNKTDCKSLLSTDTTVKESILTPYNTWTK